MIRKTILEEKRVFALLFLYAFLLMFFCSEMSPLYPFNEWPDINLYFNIGKSIFNGKALYTDVFDHKGPLIFFLYGAGYLISNTSFSGMYLIESLAWVLILFAAYLTARLFLEKIYAFVATLAFSVFMLMHTFSGGSAEEFIAVLEVISLFLFIMYFKDKQASVHNPKYMFIHGIMVAITLLTKINLVLFWFFPLLAILLNLLLNKEYVNLLKNIVAFIIGSVIIILPVIIYLLITNSLSAAWDIYITLNGKYASIADFSQIIESLSVRFYQRIRFETFGFLLALVGAFYFPIKYLGNKWGKIAIPLSFILLFVSIFLSPNSMYTYYSIPYDVYILLALIPAFQYVKISNRRWVYVVSCFVILILGIKQKDFFGMQINQLITRNHPPSLIDKFTSKLLQEENPTLLNLGLDLGNGVFTKANLIPNVKYFVSPNLEYAYYPEMRDEQTRYIENKQVQFVILCDNSFNYSYFRELPALNEYYEIIDEDTGKGNRPYYLYKLKGEN